MVSDELNSNENACPQTMKSTLHVVPDSSKALPGCSSKLAQSSWLVVRRRNESTEKI